jgi:hypothetical protein
VDIHRRFRRRLRTVLAILAALNFSGASSVRGFDKEN